MTARGQIVPVLARYDQVVEIHWRLKDGSIALERIERIQESSGLRCGRCNRRLDVSPWQHVVEPTICCGANVVGIRPESAKLITEIAKENEPCPPCGNRPTS